MSDRLVADLFTLQQTTHHTGDRHPCPWWVFKTGIRACERPQAHFLYREGIGVSKDTLLPSIQKTQFLNFMNVNKRTDINRSKKGG